MTMWLILVDWFWQINNKSHSAHVWPISGKTTTTNKNNAYKYVTNEISWDWLFNAIELWIVNVFNSISLCCRDSSFPSFSLSLSHYSTHFFFLRKIHSILLIYSRFQMSLMQYRTKHYRISSHSPCVGDQTAIFTFYASVLLAIFVGRWYLMDV